MDSSILCKNDVIGSLWWWREHY